MRRMHEAEGQLRPKLLRFSEIHRLEILQAILRLLLRIKWKRWIVLRSLVAIVELGVFLLKVSGVRQNDAAEINRCRGRIDSSAKSLLHQARNPAAVIEVRMRQNQILNVIGRQRKVLPVALAP